MPLWRIRHLRPDIGGVGLTGAQDGVQELNGLEEVEENDENEGAEDGKADGMVPGQVMDTYVRGEKDHMKSVQMLGRSYAM